MNYDDNFEEDLELREFLDSLPHNAAVLDKEGNIICVNDKWENFARQNDLDPVDCGPGVNYLQVLGTTAKEDFEDTEEVEKAINGMQSVISGDKREYAEDYPCHSPEEKRWFKMKVTPFRGGALVLHENITERRKAEIEAEEQEKLFAQAMDGISDIIGLQKPDFTILRYNQAGLERLGKELEDVKGKKCFELIGKEKRCEKCATARAKKSKKVEQVEKYLPELDGYFVCTSNPIMDEEGIINFIVEQLRDISKRKKQEDKLKKRKERLESLFSGSTSAIAALDKKHRIEEINDEFREVFGYELNEIKGKDLDKVLEKGKPGSADRDLTGKVLEGERVVDQDRRYDREGNPYDFLIKGLPIEVSGELEGIYVIYEDITELKRAEEELRRNRENLRITLNSIGDAVIATDTEGKITRMNPRAEELTGWTYDQAEGKPLEEVFEIQDARTGESVTTPVDEVLAKGRKVGLANHTQLISREGERYQIADSASPIRTKEGEIRGVVLNFRDVSEEYRMRRELERSEERFQRMLSVIPDMVSIHDPDMNIVYSNWAGLADVPEDKQELGTKCYRTYRNKEDICPDCQAKEVLETGEAFQKEVQLPEGGWYDLRVLPIKDKEGEIEYFVEWVREISEQKEREEKIEEQKERLTSIIEGADVGTWEWNVQTGEVIFNEKWAKMIGYTLEELQPISIDTWREFVHPEDLKKSQEKLTKHFKGENDQYHLECRMRHKDGHWIWVLDRGRVVTWTDDGRPEWMYGTHLDITQRKKRQEKIEYMSHHDELTDLYNRNYLEEKMKELDAMPELPLSIMMVDVNGLKLINDTYGHEIGDELLIETAEILKESTRKKDFIARWSGDEFVILLPETDIKEARKIRSRIEKSCSDIDIDGIPLTLGIGEAAKTRFEEDIFAALHEAEDNMQKDKLTRSRSEKNKLVSNLLNTLSAKSDETREHAIRMTEYAHKLGEEVNLTNGQLNNLSLLATLHDIGKVTISEDILKKPGDLNKEEWEIIKQHPERGYVIASATEEFAPIARDILYHHERWDGEGYPEGISGEEIPILSRIISIVDAYDVMTNGRSYKNPMSQEEALEEIEDCAGSQFDPELAEQFVKMMKNNKAN